MSISLYQASIPTYLQVLRATAGFMQRGLEHARENGIDPGDIVAARIHPDMRPFRFQIRSVVHHSLGAIRGIQAGEFTPPVMQTEHDYAALQGLVDAAISGLQDMGADEVDGCAGTQVIFAIGHRRLSFRAEDFLFSFSQPNFHFHVTTAYDILRMRGVPLGKRDYLGRLPYLRPA